MKLEKYNQRLLAILGTLVLVSLVVIVLISGTFFVIEIVKDFRRENRDNTLVAKPTYDSISGSLIRTQQITFESPVLIDSASRLYVIPVSQVTLEDPEEFPLVLKEKLASSANEYGIRISYYGRYNNLIVYHQPLDHREFVFPFKVSINRFSYHNLMGKFYIMAEGTKLDTNGDGFFNHNDLSSFFIYEVESKKLTEFNFPSMGLVEYYLTKDESEVILSFAIDKNKNGKIDEYQEPVILKKVGIEKMEATDFIETSRIEWLQKTVDH